MIRRLAALVCAVVLSICLAGTALAQDNISYRLPLTAEERRYAAGAGILRAVVNPEGGPYASFVNGKAVGIIPDLAAVIQQRTGLNIQIVKTTSYRAYAKKIRQGDFDLILDAAEGEFSKSSDYAYTDSYLKVDFVNVSSKTGSSQLSSVAVLPPYALSTLYAKQHYYSEQMRAYNSVAQCLAAVKEGTCSSAVLNEYAADALIDGNLRTPFVKTPSLAGNGGISVKIAMRNGEDQQGLALLNRGIAGIGTTVRSQIIRRHTQIEIPRRTALDLLYLYPVAAVVTVMILGVVAVLLLIVFNQRRRQRALVEHRHSLERFLAYFCNSFDAVYELDCSGGKCCHYLIQDGSVREEWQEFSPDFFVAEVHPKEREAMRAALSSENISRLSRTLGQANYECRWKTGEAYQWVNCILQGVRQDEDHPENCMMYLLNIQKTKAEEEQQKEVLRRAVAREENANAAKSDFLAHMSHEIRTPLNAIAGLTVIARNSEGDAQKVEECLGKIQASSHVLLNLVNDVLDMSAIEGNRLKIASEPFLLRDLLSAIAGIYEPQCRQKGIRFRLDSAGIRHENLRGDSLRINQILMNLVSNAYKFTDAGEIQVLAEEISDEGDTAFFRFTVRDTGSGMTSEMLSRIFRPFEQESADTAKKYGGSGLGLSIVKSLTEMMHGTISVQSEKGAGTTFEVNLPVEIDFAAEGEGTEELENFSAFVLAGEEESDTAKILDCLKIQYAFSTSPADAARRMRTGLQCDACFVDWEAVAPQEQGAVSAIRQTAPKERMAIVAVTSDPAKNREAALAAGADYLLEKPLAQAAVFHLLLDVIRRRPPTAAAARRNYWFPGLRVLLAEDNAVNSEIATELLKMVGAETVLAKNGAEALDKFTQAASRTYDVVLMDVQMPVMNGLEAARAIRSSGHPDAKRIPIYAMTANAFAEDVTASLNAGMNGHIAKPIDTGILYATLEKVWRCKKDQAGVLPPSQPEKRT
jgi:signal transduction histidine kinase/CheY-like chemotaxis protein/ABC-type amino acid transport substrate-binding protein